MNPIEVEKYREQILSEFADHTSDNQSDWIDTILRQLAEDMREECARKCETNTKCQDGLDCHAMDAKAVRSIEIK